MKKRKKAWIVILIVVLVLVLGIGIFLWTQSNNLEAVKYARYTPEERQLILEEHQARVDELVRALPIGQLYPLDQQQEGMLHRGEITEDAALQIIMGNPLEVGAPGEEILVRKNQESKTKSGAGGSAGSDAKNPGDAASKVMEAQIDSKSADNKGSETNLPQSEENGTLKESMARVYLLRSSFTGQLNGLIDQAKQDYVAQMKATGTVDKAALASSYISQGLSLESACDAQMEALLSDIKAELEQIGGDTSIISEIREAYQAEKSITKANLISSYM